MRIDVDIVKRVRAAERRVEVAVRFSADTDRLALYGPSGAGKTLTLQMLAGLVRPDRGRIVVDGAPWFDASNRIDLRPRERRIGYVFQDYALFPHWTVAQNVSGAFARAWPQPLSVAQARRVDHVLRSFELAEVRDSYPSQLSGGQRQRTAVARALAGEPRVLMLDEPFAALDGMLRTRLRAELLGKQRDHGVPMILITHDPDDLAACADVVVALSDGRVVDVASSAAGSTPPAGPARSTGTAINENGAVLS